MTPSKNVLASFPKTALIAVGVILLGFLTPMMLANTQPTDGPSPLSVLFKMTIGIVVTALLCVGLTRLMVRPPNAATRPTLESIASLALPGPCVVHLIRMGDRKLLVGTDVAGVKAVLELPQTHRGPGVSVSPTGATVLGPIAVPAQELDSQTIDQLLARR